VFGYGGYGSLQKFLILDDFIDEIKPDMILWQFCNNDYWNDMYEYGIKRAYPFGAVSEYVPYLEKGKIVYRKPIPFSNLRKRSKFFSNLVEIFSNFAVNKLHRQREEGTYVLKDVRISSKMEDEALKIIIEIMAMAKNRAGEVPIYFFSSHYLTEREELICIRANITCIPGIAEYIAETEEQGISMKSLDGHWNIKGNEVAGKLLANYFIKNKILERK
jgi:hypothetical protein